MTDQSIFEDKNKQEGTPSNKDSNSNESNANTETELTDLLNGIKNERGEPKYKTLKDAIIGLQNAQSYIPGLKTDLEKRDKEIERLTADAEKVAQLEDAVRKLTEGATKGDTTPKGMSQQEVADLVRTSLDNTLTQRETQAKQKQNIESVVTSLKSTFGDTAETKFNEKAAELGMSVAEFNALAAKSPQMVLTVLGVTMKKAEQSSPSQGTLNTNGMQHTAPTSIGRNKESVLLGASSDQVREESKASQRMVDELGQAGRSISDLTNPKEYFKYFGR